MFRRYADCLGCVDDEIRHDWIVITVIPQAGMEWSRDAATHRENVFDSSGLR